MPFSWQSFSIMGMYVLVAGILGLLFGGTTTDIRVTKFQIFTSAAYDVIRIAAPQKAASRLDCVRECWANYMKCFSVGYNSTAGDCTQGTYLSFSGISSTRPPWDWLYSKAFCNISAGFRLYAYNSGTVCLFVSTKATNFTLARIKCGNRGSLLYMIKSPDKFELLKRVVSEFNFPKTWISLTDIKIDGQYLWQDNTTSSSEYPIPWFFGQPDNASPDENCAGADVVNNLYLNDGLCSYSRSVICETKSLP